MKEIYQVVFEFDEIMNANNNKNNNQLPFLHCVQRYYASDVFGD